MIREGFRRMVKALLCAVALSVFVQGGFALRSAGTGDAGLKDGVYQVSFTETGMGSVTLRIEVSGGKLALISFPEGMGDADIPAEELGPWLEVLRTAPVVAEVDVISGATMPCNLVKNALAEAISKAR